MRLFISYARVDKPYCKQIIDLLDMHDVWYDHRLHIGQKWWDEIVWRLQLVRRHILSALAGFCRFGILPPRA